MISDYAIPSTCLASGFHVLLEREGKESTNWADVPQYVIIGTSIPNIVPSPVEEETYLIDNNMNVHR